MDYRVMKNIVHLFILVVLFMQVAPAQDNSQDFSDKVKKLQGIVSDIRGLKLELSVTAGVYSKKELKDFLIREISKEVPKEKAEMYQKVAVKFGLIPKDMDIMKAIIELLTSQVAGFYNNKAKELYIIKPSDSDDSDDDKTSKAQRQMLEQLYGIDADDMVMVHELMHVVQDQVLGLSSLPLDGDGNDDLVLALKGVVEGEASIVMYEYMFKDGFDTSKYMLGGSMRESAKTGKMADLPAFLTHTLVFPYSDGYDFTLKVKEAKLPADLSDIPLIKDTKPEWKNVTRLYKDPPLSTEQILHPKKYYDERDNPISIILPDVTKPLGADWNPLEQNVWGEFVVKIMLDEYNVKRTNRASAGWGGDRYTVLENSKDKKVAAVWFTTWDTEKDAKEFFTAYRELVRTKYNATKEEDIPSIGDEKDIILLEFPDSDGSLVSLERRDKDVLVLEGIPKDKLGDVKDALWKETKKEELKKIERVKEKKLY